MRVLLLTFILASVIFSSIHLNLVSANESNQVIAFNNVKGEFDRKKRQIPQQSFPQSQGSLNNEDVNILGLLNSFGKLQQESNSIVESNTHSPNPINSNYQFLQNGNHYQQNGNQFPQNGNQFLPKVNQFPQNGYQFPQNSYQFPQNGYQYPQNGNQFPQNGYQFPQNGNQFPQNGYQFPQNGNQFPQNGYQFPQNGNQLYQPGAGVNFSPLTSNSNIGLSESQCDIHIKKMESMYNQILEEIMKDVKAAANKEKDNGILQNLVNRFGTFRQNIRNFAKKITMGISDKIMEQILKVN
ncbi:TOM1-like protein 6 [Leptopilina heterotoma]|uniref:TOM1-like protein 6 n=1 Tax=Leptopilina heterotoma TaxID=63436 RepID=UPI001CA91D38|nr:TOM1-like protein 6 [Leptopilina heterotoma]